MRGINASATRSLRMAEHFAAKAEEAEDPDVANQYARSAQRFDRGFRQAILLKQRLRNELIRRRDEAARAQAQGSTLGPLLAPRRRSRPLFEPPRTPRGPDNPGRPALPHASLCPLCP